MECLDLMSGALSGYRRWLRWYPRNLEAALSSAAVMLLGVSLAAGVRLRRRYHDDLDQARLRLAQYGAQVARSRPVRPTRAGCDFRTACVTALTVASTDIQLLAQTKSLSSKFRSADHRDKLRSLVAGFSSNL